MPTEEDSVFQFLAPSDTAKTYSFKVRQTYSDGSVVDWAGPEISDTPAPTVEAKSSLGGGGGSRRSADRRAGRRRRSRSSLGDVAALVGKAGTRTLA